MAMRLGSHLQARFAVDGRAELEGSSAFEMIVCIASETIGPQDLAPKTVIMIAAVVHVHASSQTAPHCTGSSA